MKKLINDPNDVVVEALLGVEAAHPDLRVDHANKIIYRGDTPKPGKVGIISGGGSGHEPLHGGFVGLGMLDAACAGEVFTSPVPDQMLAATKLVDGGIGVLHVVKNYTGDVMNFEMAAEMAAAETGAKVVSVVTDDDVAVQDSTWTAGRRGVGVTVLLEKIAGAAAEEGRDLDAVADLARKVNANGRSMGVALTSCTVPAAGTVHEVRATPMLRPFAFTVRAMSATWSSERSCSAAAPAIFSSRTVTPTPRRPAVQVLSCTATSSSVTTETTRAPVSAAASSAAISKFITSPV